MNPVRYLLRSLGFSMLRGGRISGRYAVVLVGRAIGGWIAAVLLGRR